MIPVLNATLFAGSAVLALASLRAIIRAASDKTDGSAGAFSALMMGAMLLLALAHP